MGLEIALDNWRAEQNGATGAKGGVEFEKRKSGDEFIVQEYAAESDFTIGGIEVKKGEELHFILGIVLEPEVVDGTVTATSRGDIYSADEIRKAAHGFMTRYEGQGHDIMHSGKDDSSLKVVESWIAPMDMVIEGRAVKKGSWLMGSLVFDAQVWKAIKAGKLTGYSIGGRTDGFLER